MKTISFRDIFSATPEVPSVILVEGAAGTLKSALCFSLMIDILKDPELCGLYLTFEQNWQSHLQNMQSLGMVPPPNLLVSDYNIMRKEFRDEEVQVNFFDSILAMLHATKLEKREKLRIFTLDSLNAIYSISEENAIEEAKISFFKRLKNIDVITLLIFEKIPDQKKIKLKERFLADGIISLGIMYSKDDVVRYLQPVKLTTSEHSLNKRHLFANRDGLSLLGPVYR